MTADDPHQKRRRTAKRAAWNCFLVLSVFYLAGGLVFRLFSITLPAIKIAGGLILLLVAIDMLQARRSGTQKGAEKEEVGVTPMGIPMLAGPGASRKCLSLGGAIVAFTENQPVTPETFRFSLCRDKLRLVRNQEGQYLLRSNLVGEDASMLWQYYIQLVEVEQAFKTLKMVKNHMM
jgi:hypothetical protein